MPGVTTAYQNGVHGSRPAASAGCILYACSTHSLIYRSDGSSWATWMTIGSTTTTVASDAIWDAAGDLAVGTGADTAAKLSLGASGKAPFSNGSTLAYAYPPGYEFDYVAITSSVTVAATSEATATTVVTGSAVTYDGSTIVMIDFYCPGLYMSSNTVAKGLNLWLYDGSSSIGLLGYEDDLINSADMYTGPRFMQRRLTPSNAAHTYSIRASKDSGGTTVMQVSAGAGGSGANMPAFIRITKV